MVGSKYSNKMTVLPWVVLSGGREEKVVMTDKEEIGVGPTNGMRQSNGHPQQFPIHVKAFGEGSVFYVRSFGRH